MLLKESMFSIRVLNTPLSLRIKAKRRPRLSAEFTPCFLLYVRGLEENLAPYFMVIMMNRFRMITPLMYCGKHWTKLWDLKFTVSCTYNRPHKDTLKYFHCVASKYFYLNVFCIYSCDYGGFLILTEGQPFCVDKQRTLLLKNRTARKRTKKTFFLITENLSHQYTHLSYWTWSESENVLKHLTSLLGTTMIKFNVFSCFGIVSRLLLTGKNHKVKVKV